MKRTQSKTAASHVGSVIVIAFLSAAGVQAASVTLQGSLVNLAELGNFVMTIFDPSIYTGVSSSAPTIGTAQFQTASAGAMQGQRSFIDIGGGVPPVNPLNQQPELLPTVTPSPVPVPSAPIVTPSPLPIVTPPPVQEPPLEDNPWLRFFQSWRATNPGTSGTTPTTDAPDTDDSPDMTNDGESVSFFDEEDPASPAPLSTCGNGRIDPGEDCEGTGLTTVTCRMRGFAGGYALYCRNCRADTSECTMCGNGVIDEGEQCDGLELNGQDCRTRGLSQGILRCTNCRFDTSRCTNGNRQDETAPCLAAGEICGGARYTACCGGLGCQFYGAWGMCEPSDPAPGGGGGGGGGDEGGGGDGGGDRGGACNPRAGEPCCGTPPHHCGGMPGLVCNAIFGDPRCSDCGRENRSCCRDNPANPADDAGNCTDPGLECRMGACRTPLPPTPPPPAPASCGTVGLQCCAGDRCNDPNSSVCVPNSPFLQPVDAPPVSICRACGNENEVCCNSRFPGDTTGCNGNLLCSGPALGGRVTCVEPLRGGEGDRCRPDNTCNAGLRCDPPPPATGTCVPCGRAGGQLCCVGAGVIQCDQRLDLECRSNTCQPVCGRPAGPCCEGENPCPNGQGLTCNGPNGRAPGFCVSEGGCMREGQSCENNVGCCPPGPYDQSGEQSGRRLICDVFEMYGGKNCRRQLPPRPLCEVRLRVDVVRGGCTGFGNAGTDASGTLCAACGPDDSGWCRCRYHTQPSCGSVRHDPSSDVGLCSANANCPYSLTCGGTVVPVRLPTSQCWFWNCWRNVVQCGCR